MERGVSTDCHSIIGSDCGDDESPSFWDVHRMLGQCYEAEIARLRDARVANDQTISDQDLKVPQIPRNENSFRSLPSMRQGNLRRPSLAAGSITVASGASMRETVDERIARSVGHILQQLVSSMPAGCSYQRDNLPEELRDAEILFIPLSFWSPDAATPSVPARRPSVATLAMAPTVPPKSLAAPRGLCRSVILLPTGRLRTAWDLLSILCLFLDLLVPPLDVFSAQWPDSTNNLLVLFPVFWMCDILVVFCTPFYDRGTLECRHRKIARKYAQEWLSFDIMYVVLDWVVIFSEELPAQSKTALRLVQFFLRFIRLTRLSKMSERLKGRIISEILSANASIFQISLQILLIHHLLACCWYCVGTWDPADGWVARNLASRTADYQYSTSLHWTFCQLGFGGTEIEPNSTPERIFGIIMSLMALAMFSTLLGTIASHTAMLGKSTEERRHLFRQLGNFLSHNRVPTELAQRIHCFLEHAYAVKQEAILETKVPLLDLLSRSLRGELQRARHEGYLGQLDFLSLLPAVQRSDAVRRLAYKALQQRLYTATDTVFEGGNVAVEAIFLKRGSFTYVLNTEKQSMTRECWVVEMCLWTPWLHLGELTARKDCEVIAVKAEDFHESMRRSFDTLQAAQSYARDYVEAMNAAVLVTDVWKKVTDPVQHDEVPEPSPTICSFRLQRAPPSASSAWMPKKLRKFFPPAHPDFSKIVPRD